VLVAVKLETPARKPSKKKAKAPKNSKAQPDTTRRVHPVS